MTMTKDTYRLSRHVYYEIEMLYHTANLIAIQKRFEKEITIENRILQNAALESFGVHFRSVVDFLYMIEEDSYQKKLTAKKAEKGDYVTRQKRNFDSDLCARDYISDPDVNWPDTPLPPAGTSKGAISDIRTARSQINIQFAHATIHRIDDDENELRRWDVVALLLALEPRIKLFLQRCPPTVLREEYWNGLGKLFDLIPRNAVIVAGATGTNNACTTPLTLSIGSSGRPLGCTGPVIRKAVIVEGLENE